MLHGFKLLQVNLIVQGTSELMDIDGHCITQIQIETRYKRTFPIGITPYSPNLKHLVGKLLWNLQVSKEVRNIKLLLPLLKEDGVVTLLSRFVTLRGRKNKKRGLMLKSERRILSLFIFWIVKPPSR